jgi:drug/metabolite transporter (DMT)-like permease
VPYSGEVAALLTSCCWVGSALFHDAAARRIGSLSMNLLRLLLAAAFLALYGSLTTGQPFPTDAPTHAWTWLTASGLVGFTFGDLCLFRAYLVIGPRLAMLIMALSPLVAALLGWRALGETLDARALGGMAVTMAGVAWVVRERPEGEHPEANGRRGRGVLLALGGALGQGGGLVLSKIGMGQMDAFAATQIRVLAGCLGFAAVFAAVGWWPRFLTALRDTRALGFATGGALFGPFVGVGLSLYAVQHARVGVAATLMALTPVMILAPLRVLRHERISLRTALGTVVAVAGVGLLFR